MNFRGIYHRGNKFRWEVMVNGKREVGYADTQAEAVRARDHAKKSMELGAYDSKDPTTLGGMVHLMLQTEWSPENCKSSDWFARNCRLIMTYFLPQTPLVEITAQRIMAYTLYLKEERGSSNGTINRKLAALSKLLRVAAEQGYIKDKPVIRRQREPQGRIRFLTEHEEEEMLRFFIRERAPIPLNAVILLIDTGIRCGELQKLIVDDINWTAGKHGTITLRDTKNGTNRTVPLTPRAAQACHSLLHMSEDEIHLVPQEENWLRTPWVKMRKALGLEHDPEFVPHALRHTCASRLVQRGVPLFTVSKWLGHKSIATTKRYAHLRPEDLYDAVDVLEKGYTCP